MTRIQFPDKQFIRQIVLRNFIPKIYFLSREIKYKSEFPIGVGKSNYIYDQNSIPRQTIYLTDCFEEFYS